ncbi:MAG TPA: AAA family ATPase [Tepidisphaeraceae bacterium]|nr:AAA family ATPase [Tepidisphaeraceae bacterium]
MMLKAIRFRNYKAFQEASLPLEPLTILIGPNGSGKTSALSAIQVMAAVAGNARMSGESLVPIGLDRSPCASALEAVWDNSEVTEFTWEPGKVSRVETRRDPLAREHVARLQSGRVYVLEPAQIGAPVNLIKTLSVQENGYGLPSALTTLQDHSPERFGALNEDLRLWLPEFDRIVFDTPSPGQRSIALRTRQGKHSVPTSKLSTGTLLSLALLSICHLPDPPKVIGLEEPDHGIHPRLLRNLKDSLLRLTSPEVFDDERDPVQVIVTTHSPYLVDLFRDELESIVVTHKEGLYAKFSRLSDLPQVADIVKDSALGEAWYSGLLGGVPVGS